MPQEDEFLPDLPIINEVVKVAILPVIQCCEETLGESLAADFQVLVHGVIQHSSFLAGMRGHKNDKQSGYIRLIFRRTNNPIRCRFHCEAIYTELAASKSGFSGFTIRGDVRVEPSRIHVSTKGGAYRHNVWEWQGWV
jgi:hypothetical protein